MEDKEGDMRTEGDLKDEWSSPEKEYKWLQTDEEKGGHWGRGSPVQPPHIFPRKGYNLRKPTKGQEQSNWCQLHPSSQPFFPLSTSVHLSFVQYLAFSLSASLSIFSIYFDGTYSINCGLKVGCRSRVRVLFKDLVSFNNLGFCSVWLAGSGVPLQFQRLTSPIFITVKTQREREEKMV